MINLKIFDWLFRLEKKLLINLKLVLSKLWSYRSNSTKRRVVQKSFHHFERTLVCTISSVLFKQWKDIWTTLRFVDFDWYGHNLPNTNFKFFSKFLSNRNNQFNILEFLIDYRVIFYYSIYIYRDNEINGEGGRKRDRKREELGRERLEKREYKIKEYTFDIFMSESEMLISGRKGRS